MWGTDGAALWGFDAGVSVGEVEPTLAIGSLLAEILGGRAGANKRIARCSTGFTDR